MTTWLRKLSLKTFGDFSFPARVTRKSGRFVDWEPPEGCSFEIVICLTPIMLKQLLLVRWQYLLQGYHQGGDGLQLLSALWIWNGMCRRVDSFILGGALWPNSLPFLALSLWCHLCITKFKVTFRDSFDFNLEL